jgi:hypothetical protein
MSKEVTRIFVSPAAAGAGKRLHAETMASAPRAAIKRHRHSEAAPRGAAMAAEPAAGRVELAECVEHDEIGGARGRYGAFTFSTRGAAAAMLAVSHAPEIGAFPHSNVRAPRMRVTRTPSSDKGM